MHTDTDARDPLSERIIGCAFRVANALGPGFLEKVYENALAFELRDAGFAVAQQRGIAVLYRGMIVGQYVADLVVDDAVLVELKAAKSLDEIHLAQCLHYLKATNLRLCLLLNFGAKRLQIKRLVQ